MPPLTGSIKFSSTNMNTDTSVTSVIKSNSDKLHEEAFPKCGIFVLKKCFLRMLVHVTYHYSIWNAFQSLSSNKSSFDGKFISMHMHGFEMF